MNQFITAYNLREIYRQVKEKTNMRKENSIQRKKLKEEKYENMETLLQKQTTHHH